MSQESIKLRHLHPLIRLLKHAESVLCIVSVFSSLISFKDSTFGAVQFASSQILGSKLFFLLGILVSRSLSSHHIYLYSLCVFLCLVLSKAHPTASAHFICFSFVGLPHTVSAADQGLHQALKTLLWDPDQFKTLMWELERFQELHVRTWAALRALWENLSFKSSDLNNKLLLFVGRRPSSLVCNFVHKVWASSGEGIEKSHPLFCCCCCVHSCNGWVVQPRLRFRGIIRS